MYTVNDNNVAAYDGALDILVENPAFDITKFREVCNGDMELASEIAYVFKNRFFADIKRTSAYMIIQQLNNGRAAAFQRLGGFAEELKQLRIQAEEENALKQLQKDNLKLQNENLEYAKTIREQEQKIRVLDHKLKIVELIKVYWWVIATAFGVGLAFAKIIFN